MLRGVHHVGYLVKHIDPAIVSFQKLGFSLTGSVTHDEHRKVDIAFLENGSYRVELVSPYSEDSVVFGLLKVYRNAPYHLCYISTDLVKDAEALSHQGFMIFEPECPAPAISNRKVIFLMSASIGIIELVEDSQ
jgi:methylmalonyl-CoA/ethylmalonyl-CoA epimerase